MKNTTIRSLLSWSTLLVALVGLSGTAQAQRRYGGGITVYADVNFSGEARTFRSDVPNLVELGMNDAISSIQIADGEAWQVCQDVNYQNRCQVLTGSVADLRTLNWNDRISSMRRVNGGYGYNRYNDNGQYAPYDNSPNGSYSRNNRMNQNEITLFTGPNFRGRSATFSDSVPNLVQYGLNDRVLSMEIPNGETWQFCQDVDFGGPCQTVSGSVSDLRSLGWGDRISSMRRVSGRRWFAPWRR